MSRTITLRRPDDLHIHLRDESVLPHTVRDVERTFARALVMPNLTPAVTNAARALEYRERIKKHASTFEPLMTIYLTASTSAQDLREAFAAGVVAAKLYPKGATTNSSAGVSSVEHLYPVFEAMQSCGMVLCVHGEVTNEDVDIFDREAVFIERTLLPLVRAHPKLRVVLEHVTTSQGCDFVRGHENVAATITAHHLLFNRNDLLSGGIKTHRYCLPILKSEQHRRALVKAATSGHARFFLGSDSAPHARGQKECASGCAGSYTAPHALELYAQVFDDEGALDKLENFASVFGAEFYKLALNEGTVTLIEKASRVADTFAFGDDVVVPIFAGQTLRFSLV